MKIPTPMTSAMPKQVRCPACELIQYEREHCRRCKRSLPRPEVVFGPFTPVRTFDELERLAIEDALKKSQSVSDAARRLGIGRTTLYGKLRRYELSSGPAREMPVGRSLRLKFRNMYQHLAGNGP
jgi:transcriptional regulator with GAF, ATPase, and Fis domain